MEIGVSTASFFGSYLNEDAVVVINKLNCVKTIEVFLSTFQEYTEKFAMLVKGRLGNLSVHSIHALTNQFEPELFNQSQRTREDSEMVLRDVCRAGEILNAKYYTFHGATRLKKIAYNFNYKDLAKKINRIASIMGEYNISFTYENVHWSYFSNPDYFNQLLPYLNENIYTCLDIKQAMQGGHDYTDFLPVMKGRIKTVHVCDYNEDRSLCIPGRGIVDFVKLFRNLSEIGYNGPVLLEVYKRDYETNEEIVTSINYLKECYEKSQK